MLRVAFAANDQRAEALAAALARFADPVIRIAFDHIDGFTKYAAGLLSYGRPRSEWWGNYHMHPLVQRRRRLVFQRALRPQVDRVDVLLFWGSWFKPLRNAAGPRIPYFNYVDESRSLVPVLGEVGKASAGRRRGYKLQAETYRDSSGIFPFSEWARAQTLATHAVDPEKVEAVGWGPCAIDLSSEDIPSSVREPLVLHVSNAFHRKGVDFLLETARIVGQAEPRAKFVVVGKDSEGTRFGGAGNVEFTGQITDRARLSDYFRRASVFFLPYRFDRSPHALVEAMSAGVPFVASAQGGSMELAAGGGAGFCIPIGDVEGYAKAVLMLLRQSGLRDEMGARGKAIMLQRYNWPAVAQRITTLMSRQVDRYREQGRR